MSRLFTHHDRLVLWEFGSKKRIVEAKKSGDDDHDDDSVAAPHNSAIYVPHVHKILGLIALVNIAFYQTPLFSFAQTYVGEEKLKMLMHVHVLLALTSFEFRIGRSRSNTLYTIYREMQLHTCIFTMRSWAVMVGALYFNVQSVLLRACYVLVWHVLADLATKFYGTPTGGTTIRRTTDGGKTTGYKDHNAVTQWAVWFLSFAQLVGTYMLLTDSVDSARMAMCVMGPVQLSALLATLVRKGYFSTQTSFICYLSILLPIFFIHQWRPIDVAFIVAVTLLRFNMRISKYVMWIGVVLAYTYLSGELGSFVESATTMLGANLPALPLTPPAMPLLWNNTEFAGVVTGIVESF